MLRLMKPDETPQEYADRILRFAAGVPCYRQLLDEEDDSPCECYGCAGRKYVALAKAQEKK